MTAQTYEDDGYDEITSMVLRAVSSINIYKRNINYSSLFNNDSHLYGYDSENETTYATNRNNHQLYDSSNNNASDNNDSINFSDDSSSTTDNYWALLALILVFSTAAGNILVCLAIAWEKRLQNVTNYFLASLAITDLMVAVLVMPLGIVTLYRGNPCPSLLKDSLLYANARHGKFSFHLHTY